MPLRTVVFWTHLVAAVVAGVVILVMSVTGVLLTYERQMIAWSDRQFRSQPSDAGATRLPVESFLAVLDRQHPELAVAGVTVQSDPSAPVTVQAGRQTLYADAYTGRLLGESTQGMRRFMSETRAWHRWLAVEGEGRAAGAGSTSARS